MGKKEDKNIRRRTPKIKKGRSDKRCPGEVFPGTKQILGGEKNLQTKWPDH